MSPKVERTGASAVRNVEREKLEKKRKVHALFVMRVREYIYGTSSFGDLAKALEAYEDAMEKLDG